MMMMMLMMISLSIYRRFKSMMPLLNRFEYTFSRVAYSRPLSANTMPSIKPEVHNVSPHENGTTAIGNTHQTMVKIGRVVTEMGRLADNHRQTGMFIAIRERNNEEEEGRYSLEETVHLTVCGLSNFFSCILSLRIHGA